MPIKRKLNEWDTNKSVFVIEYQSPYSKGTIIVDTKFYQKHINKFERKMKDCVILSMIEREKEFEDYL